MNLKKIIVAFFFAVSCNFSFGHEITSPQSTIDSAKIYYDLIAEENYQAYSRPNVIGMIAGGSLTVVGGALVGFGLYASSALQLMIFPELNFIEKRGGVNAVVRF